MKRHTIDELNALSKNDLAGILKGYGVNVSLSNISKGDLIEKVLDTEDMMESQSEVVPTVEEDSLLVEASEVAPVEDEVIETKDSVTPVEVEVAKPAFTPMEYERILKSRQRIPDNGPSMYELELNRRRGKSGHVTGGAAYELELNRRRRRR